MRAPDTFEVGVGIVMAIMLLLLSLAPSTPVRADVDPSTQRFEAIGEYTSHMYRDVYTFSVFHDKLNGEEIVCIHNDMHFVPSCLPTGKKW